jgi:hypothetical protein
MTMKSLVMVAAAIASATLVLPTVSQARTVGSVERVEVIDTRCELRAVA